MLLLGGGSETDPNGRRQILLKLLLKPKCWHLKEREAHVIVFLLPGVGLPRLEPEVGLLARNGAAASALGVPGSKPGTAATGRTGCFEIRPESATRRSRRRSRNRILVRLV